MTEAITLPERDHEHERALRIVFNLSPAQAGILSCLSRGIVASSDELLNYVGAKSNIKVVVSRTRQRIAEHGFTIKSKIGAGYWIEPEDRKGIEKLVAKFMEGK